MVCNTYSRWVASEAISAGVTDSLQKGTGSGQYAILANRIKNAVAAYDARLMLVLLRQSSQVI
ncbi:hypothetical protein JCM31271_35890 [Halorubrum trueperi]